MERLKWSCSIKQCNSAIMQCNNLYSIVRFIWVEMYIKCGYVTALFSFCTPSSQNLPTGAHTGGFHYSGNSDGRCTGRKKANLLAGTICQ